MRTRLLAVAAALAALACSSGDDGGAPRPASVEPASGPSGQATRVTIRGDGFLAAPSTQQSGGGAQLDVRHRAWLGDAELEQVTWVDVHTLQATVPAGLAPGPRRLVVENALGRRGALDAAYEVLGGLPAALEAAIAAEPATVNVGQAVAVTLTLVNGGDATADLTSIAPERGGTAAATCGAVTPAPAPLATGASATYRWTCTASAPGTLTLSGTATGTDATSGAAVTATPASPASVAVQTPAALTASLAADGTPAQALVGQAVAMTLTVNDTGSAGASITRVQPSATPPSAASCGAVDPPPPQPIAGNGSRAFRWTCTMLAAADVALGAGVGGTDANSGATLQAAAPAVGLQVILPAALTATVTADRATANPDQPVHVTFRVVNGGSATANVTAIQPSHGGAAPATCSAPAPAPGPIAASASATFDWTCVASAPGPLTLSGTATGTDAVSGAPLSAAPASPAAVAVQAPAALSASISAAPASVTAGEPLAVTLRVANGGEASARVSSVSPQASGAGTTCGPVTPDGALAVAGGTEATFGWTCTPAAAGTALLGAAVSGTDLNTGAALQALAEPPASVTVGTGGAVTASLAASPMEPSAGQDVAVTLTVTNGAVVPADVTSVSAAMPGASPGCTDPSPPSQAVPAGESRAFSWTCSAAEPGAYVLEATATSTPALQSQPAPLPVTVLAPAALAPATVQASRSTISTGQTVPVSLLLHNSGAGAAHVTALATGATGAGAADCTTPALPPDLAGGGSVEVAWTCSGLTAGAVSLSASVTAVDAGSGADASPAIAPADLTVQLAPAITAALASDAASVPVNTPMNLTLSLRNDGQAAARVESVSRSSSSSGTNPCTSPAPSTPLDLPGGGGTAEFTWSCTPSRAATYTLDATVAATDANGGPAPTVTVAPATVIATP